LRRALTNGMKREVSGKMSFLLSSKICAIPGDPLSCKSSPFRTLLIFAAWYTIVFLMEYQM